MDPLSFKGTIFHVWKGNRACRIYVTDGHVYFIRRVVPINPGKTAVLSSQFGLIGGLAAGLASAANAKGSADFVRDDDPTPPDQLVSKHADNYAIPISDLIDSRFEPKGKHFTYGNNAGRWHFTRRGEEKETVVLLESAADASQAELLLRRAVESRQQNDAGTGGDPVPETGSTQSAQSTDDRGSDLVTSLPIPPEHAEVVSAMQNLTQVLGEQTPAGWQKVHCEVRPSSPDNPRPLRLVIGDGDRPDEWRPATDPVIYEAAMRVARKLSSSVSTFPGLIVEMTRLDHGRWRNHVTLMEKR